MHFILWVLTYETRAKNINTIQLNTEIATKATTKMKKKRNMKIMKILNYVVGQASECKNYKKIYKNIIKTSSSRSSAMMEV